MNTTGGETWAGVKAQKEVISAGPVCFLVGLAPILSIGGLGMGCSVGSRATSCPPFHPTLSQHIILLPAHGLGGNSVSCRAGVAKFAQTEGRCPTQSRHLNGAAQEDLTDKGGWGVGESVPFHGLFLVDFILWLKVSLAPAVCV